MRHKGYYWIAAQIAPGTMPKFEQLAGDRRKQDAKEADWTKRSIRLLLIKFCGHQHMFFSDARLKLGINSANWKENGTKQPV